MARKAYKIEIKAVNQSNSKNKIFKKQCGNIIKIYKQIKRILTR